MASYQMDVQVCAFVRRYVGITKPLHGPYCALDNLRLPGIGSGRSFFVFGRIVKVQSAMVALFLFLL